MSPGPAPSAVVSWTLPGPRLLSDAEVSAAVRTALAHGGRPHLLLSVVFVSDAELARLHHEYLGDPSPTDVLAFDLAGGGGDGVAGELYVSVERARAEARARDLSPERELALYVVHGCLHLCGHDDRESRPRARMRASERAVLARLGYDFE
jgi:probable rRNA maturation factor